MAKRCYYEVLGVTRTATEIEITKAYRGLAKKYHPDQNPGDEEVLVRYHEVSEAYEVLRDDRKRQVYDRHGHAGLTNGGAGDVDLSGFVGDLIEGFEGIFGGRRRGRGSRRGADIEDVLDVELLEAATGVKKSVSIQYIANCKACSGTGAKPGTQPAQCRRCKGSGEEVTYLGPIPLQQPCRGCGGRGVVIPDPCPSCRGAGRVETRESIELTIPAGVDTRVRLTVPGHGHEGPPGTSRGNLELIVRVRDHKTFRRNGHNLECRHAIKFALAALGGTVEVTTLTGQKVPVEVPRGSQTHTTVLRVPGHGMPDLDDPRTKGDLLVQLVLETPTKLSEEQEQLFRRLAELDGITPQQQKGIFGKLKDLITGEGPPTDQKK